METFRSALTWGMWCFILFGLVYSVGGALRDSYRDAKTRPIIGVDFGTDAVGICVWKPVANGLRMETFDYIRFIHVEPPPYDWAKEADDYPNLKAEVGEQLGDIFDREMTLEQTLNRYKTIFPESKKDG